MHSAVIKLPIKAQWRVRMASAWALLTLACLVGLEAWAGPARVALVVGNADYAQKPLRNPVNDATDLAAALRSSGFEVLERKNRTADELRRDLADFQDKLGPGVTGLFYFAGHGVQAGRGMNYLLPVGVQYRRERDVELYGLEVGSVLRRMEESGTSLNLVILDACRDSPLPPEGRSTASRGLGRMEAPSGSLIAFATAPGSVADDNRAGRNGLYTQHLLEAIRTPGLPLETVFKRVRRGVEQDSNRRQSPEEISKLTSDEPFYFVASVRPEPRPDPGPTAVQVEQQAWEAAQRANTVKAYDAFLREYPNGWFVGAARVARAGIVPVQQVPEARPGPADLRTGQVVKDCDVCPELVVLPAGSFQMGSLPNAPDRYDDEVPVRAVRVAGFLLGRTEVTQGQWKAVMGSNPSYFKNCGDDCPVERVSWEDAQAYARRLSERTGKAYRLPSEAESECAARAGSRTRWAFGDDEGQLGTYAWFSGNSSGNTRAAAGKRANEWGLHDMHGNVWEWVQDVYHKNYEGAPTDGAAWMTGGDQERRVLRGGSWNDVPQYLRAANRFRYTPDIRDYGTGFRIARTL